MQKERIGFVGVGMMGAGMAANIVANGYPLTVIAHRSRQSVDALVSKGASEAASLGELAAASDVVFICAPGSPQVEATVDGLAPDLKSGSVVVDCSTSDPTSTLRLADRLAQTGCHMADAPLGGTPAMAAEGKLSAMVGADRDVFSRIEPIIETWASAIVHLGPVGDGHKMKLLNNFLSLGYGAIYAEALTLGSKVGISPQTFDSVIRGSRMDCGFYQTYMACIIDGQRDSHKFTITNATKDARYLTAMADAAGIANPVASAVKNTFAAALAQGGGGPEDYVPHSAEFVARANGVQLND